MQGKSAAAPSFEKFMRLNTTIGFSSCKITMECEWKQSHLTKKSAIALQFTETFTHVYMNESSQHESESIF